LVGAPEWPIALGDILLAFAALNGCCARSSRGARARRENILTDHFACRLIVFGAAAGPNSCSGRNSAPRFYFLLTVFALVDFPFARACPLRRRRGNGRGRSCAGDA